MLELLDHIQGQASILKMLHPVRLLLEVLEVVGVVVDLLSERRSWSSSAETYPPVPNSGIGFGLGGETSEPNFR